MPRLFVVASLVLWLAACNQTLPLANTHASAAALATAVLNGVRAADRQALEQLALSEREFREHVWPRLPAARPERNLPFSYVWGDLRQKSELALTATIQRYRGRLFDVIHVSFSEVTDYVDYKVHRDATFQVRDSAGRESDLQVCGSLIERDGAWKVFSYVVDD
jgi:hypothetical protein